MIRILNTLTEKKDEFKPIEEGRVSMYVCGPTVYNLIHIGNARPMIVFDAVRRYFLYRGYEVNFVSNFTDVDDKIIKEAIAENSTASEISERYIKECKKDMEAMGIMPATTNPKATEEIPSMIEMIKTLIEKDFAYVADDGTVYYRIRKFSRYGELSHKNIDDLEPNSHRSLLVNGEDKKEDPLDFVLWKPKKEGEPFWESPWCDGRPGWHIECSCMSKRYLGETIDIHAGGEDLIFPHHENEIAQSEAANGVPFAHYWMHNAFLNINNQKMSKSLGNFFTVRDILKEYEGRVLRFFILSAHYRTPLNFSKEIMESNKASFQRIITCNSRLSELYDSSRINDDEDDEIGDSLYERLNSFRQAFCDNMDDDFNTAGAIGTIFELVKFINQNADENTKGADLSAMRNTLLELTEVLGLDITENKGSLDDDIEALINERQEARKAKDFKRADEIRDDLKSRGIILEDTKDGVKWHREN